MPGSDLLACFPKDGSRYSEQYQMCLAPSQIPQVGPNAPEMVLSLPVDTPAQGIRFLEHIGSPAALAGDTMGTGISMSHLGKTIPPIREAYIQAIKQFEEELVRRVADKSLSRREVAQWAVKQRQQIVSTLRAQEGKISSVLLEIRDTAKYGKGGRTYANLSRRAVKKGITDVDNYLISSSTRSNHRVSQAAIKGGRYLKHGGKVLLVISVSLSMYTILTAPEDQMERVLYEEVGGLAGGAIGTAAMVGICIAFGVATAGWGVLACGVVGGIAGGVGGSMAGKQLYYAKERRMKTRPTPIPDFVEFDPNDFSTTLPPNMCVP